MALEQEYRVFKDHLSELLTKGEGKFALVKGEKIVDAFTSYEDALKKGLETFGNVPFLIKEISRGEDINFFYTHLIR